MLFHKLGKYSNTGTLILRLVFGLVFLFHGYLKVIDISGTAGFLSSLGVPVPLFFTIVVTAVEFLGGILLILGLLTRLVGLLLAIDMLVALIIVHAKNGFFIVNGGYEFVLVLMAVGVMYLLHGAGKYSLDAKLFKKH